MKQTNLFGSNFEKNEKTKYSGKIIGPIYEPKNIPPHIFSLIDNKKTNRIVNKIKNSNVTEDEKDFLIKSANRHLNFDYQKIADYYAHASTEMQILMEQQALIIIDFEQAYQYGYINLAHSVANQYFENYGE
ncbi:MAG: hypothetical protein ACOYMA_22670 [Bacteroidia bacterium]